MTVPKIAASALCVGLLALVGAAAGGKREENDGGKDKGRPARLQVPIAGTVTDPAGGTFAGTFTLQRFAESEGKLVAIGMVSGSSTVFPCTPGRTELVGPVALPVAVSPGEPVTGAGAVVLQQQSCQVLHLEIGPVDLNLLGLHITTLPIGIDISGETGGTDVLGRLICLILETVNNVLGLVGLLNQLLGILGGLAG